MNHSATLPPLSLSDESLDRAVAQIVTQLEAGNDVNLEQFADDNPYRLEQLQKLLPTLQAMVSLGHVAEAPEPTLSSASSPIQARALLGDFQITREIGRGGMGVVYEAEQLSLGRKVALKVLPFAAMLDQRQLARFQNEARAAATLYHPNIVPVFFVGNARGVHFYAMQLIEGGSLAEVIAGLRDEGPGIGDQRLVVEDVDGDSSGKAPGADSSRRAERKSGDRPPSQSQIANPQSQLQTVAAALSTIRSTDPKRYFKRIAELGIQAAHALDHAHQHGIIHRDIKPANLLLDADGKLLITDFGLARIGTDGSMTTTGELVGTLRYMSPEQALAKRGVVDHRSDVYSLGITLYEMATLQPAFTGTDREELLRQIAQDNPKPPRQIDASVPRNFETILLKSIAKDPSARYESAADLADDLRQFADDQPIIARRQSRLYRFSQFARKHRVAVGAIASVILALSVGTAIAIFGFAQAVRQRDMTAAALAQADANLDRSIELINEALEPTIHHFEFTPTLEPAYSSLLENVAAFYASLPDDALKKPNVRLGIARAKDMIAWMNLNRGGDASVPALESIEILKPLAAYYSDDGALREGLASAYVSLAHSYTKESEWKKAASAMHDAVRHQQAAASLDPSDRQVQGELVTQHGLIGYLLSMAGEFDLSTMQFDEGLRLARQQRIAGGFSMMSLSQRYAGHLIRIGRFRDAKTHLENARYFLDEIVASRLGNSQQLLHVYWSQLVAATSGELKLCMGDYNQTAEDLRLAIEHVEPIIAQSSYGYLSHQLGYLWHWRGEALAQMGDYQEAIAAHRHSQESWAESDIHFAKYHIGLAEWRIGEILHELGETDKSRQPLSRAQSTFEEIAASRPGDALNSERLIVSLCISPNAALCDPKRAVRVAQRFVNDASTNGLFWRYVGLARYYAGDFKSAEEAISTSTQLRNGDALDWLLLAGIFHGAGNQAKALSAYDRAMAAIAAESPVYYGHIGLLGFRRIRREIEALMRHEVAHHSSHEAAPPMAED